MSRRVMVATAGWLAAVTAAVLAGLSAVRLIDPGSGSGGEVLTPQQVAEQLAGAPATPSAAPAPSRPVEAVPKVLSGPGGTVVAECHPGGFAYLVSWTPAPGYRVEDVQRGPSEHADVRFEGPGRSQARVRCEEGVPSAEWRD